MKPLTIDWLELELAFDDHPSDFVVESTNYFDVQSGKVVVVDEEISGAVENIKDELDEVWGEDADWTDAAIRETSAFQTLSEYQQASVLVAIKIDYDDTNQFERIPSFDSHDSFEWMRDFIETVNNDSDLAPLAKLGRQLSGHMNSHRAGADVFLASEDAEYLGRTCPWRDCGPGFRTSCDALHCGLRPYLHDDLNSVCLKKGLITQPPLLLWPKVAAAQEVPADVRAQLIESLVEDKAK